MPPYSARARVLATLSGYFALVLGSGGYVAWLNWHSGHAARASIVVLLTLAAYATLARIQFVRLRDIRHDEEQVATLEKPYDETIWGVGGPAMRTPGETGVLKRPDWASPPR